MGHTDTDGATRNARIARIGLFGGTFDPVHKGHLAIARQAAQEARLDQVLFIPAADPPHKARLGASYRHRVAMLETLLGHSVAAGYRFAVSLLEAELPFPSYTVDTLFELKKGSSIRDVISLSVLIPCWICTAGTNIRNCSV